MITVSCPGRVDIGNSIDYPNYFLSIPNGESYTSNIAIGLRTKIRYSPSKTIVVKSIEITETSLTDNSRFKIIWYFINYFGIKSGEFEVISNIPRSSGLGGSSAIITSMLILCLLITKKKLHEISLQKIVLFSHLFENWLGIGTTGFQDQMSSVYGGCALYQWGGDFFNLSNNIHKREVISNNETSKKISKRLLLAYTGEPHPPNVKKEIKYLNKDTQEVWKKVSLLAKNFFHSLKKENWEEASRILKKENELRSTINKNVLSNKTRELIKIANKNNIGCRFVGHGHGGYAWAISTKEKIRTLKNQWNKTVTLWDEGDVFFPRVANEGIKINDKRKFK